MVNIIKLQISKISNAHIISTIDDEGNVREYAEPGTFKATCKMAIKIEAKTPLVSEHAVTPPLPPELPPPVEPEQREDEEL